MNEESQLSIQKRKNKDGTTSFVARVRNEYGKQFSQTFRKRGDAVQWEARETLKLATGDWISPYRGKFDRGGVGRAVEPHTGPFAAILTGQR
jgi:hypothetical protein